MDLTEIQSFYAEGVVFLTGASGFIGKVMLEKILRTCPQVRKIYLLMRSKKDKDPAKRFDEMFNEVIFKKLEEENPMYRRKVEIVTGDLREPFMGISEADKEILINEVNLIFHVAATVKFDENLKIAVNINVRSVRDLIIMAKQMKQLKSFVYISTAFSHSLRSRKEIAEEIYDVPITPQKALNLTEVIDEDLAKEITPHVIKEFANTYVFTKALAEKLVQSEGSSLPIGIFRPAIVVNTYHEPVPGWIDNFYGPCGILVGTAMGLIRILKIDRARVAELVPCDYVVNSALVAAHDVHKKSKKRELLENSDDGIPVYNFVSSSQKPITWDKYNKVVKTECYKIPTPIIIWHYILFLTPNIISFTIGEFFLHTIPAYILDFIAKCLGRKPILVKAYTKIAKLTSVLSYFGCNSWIFSNKNTIALWENLSDEDRELFNFNMDKFSWDEYLKVHCFGCRMYLLKEPMDTVPAGFRKIRLLAMAHYTLLTVLAYLFYLLCSFLYRMFL